jgi:endonuclease-3 related protein
MTNLRAAECMTPKAMRQIPEEELALLIRPSGYFNTKAKKLKAMVEYLARYDDDFDRWHDREAKELRAELLSVYGIGPETADDIVLYVANLPTFVMDSYTQRIVDRLGLMPAHRTYGGYQALFEDNLPAETPLFNEYHALLDFHAKGVCTKRTPHCEGCCLLDLCPTGKEQAFSK